MSRSVSAPSSVTNTSPCWNGFIVPGSTFRYGSSFCIVTRRPRAFSRLPRLLAVSPLPSEEVTPPVTKTCLVVRGGCTKEGSRDRMLCGAGGRDPREFRLTRPSRRPDPPAPPAASRPAVAHLVADRRRQQLLGVPGAVHHVAGQHPGQLAHPVVVCHRPDVAAGDPA